MNKLFYCAGLGFLIIWGDYFLSYRQVVVGLTYERVLHIVGAQ